MKLIITRPQHDFTTRYLSSWAEEIIQLAKKKGIDVIDLLQDKANRKELEGRIKKLSPELLFLNGHGNDDCVTGQDNKILIQADDNHRLLNGMITYALSCNSAKVLGQKASEDDNTTYIGYIDGFIFSFDRNYISRPSEDPKAKPFKESSNQLMVSLLKGHTARKSSDKSKKSFNEHFRRLLASDADPDSLQSAQFLWWNMRNQVCLGKENAKLDFSKK